MEMSGRHLLPADRATVWLALNDPEVLKECIPGCQALDRKSDTEYAARVAIIVGPVEAAFTGVVRLERLDPPNGYTLVGEGQAGPAGSARGAAEVTLTPARDGTELSYVVQAQIGGRLAQLGSRLIDSTAKRLADTFFSAFAARMETYEPSLPPPGPSAWTDRLDHTPAGVPQLGDEPGEPEVIDKTEEGAEALERAEERIEIAAGRGVLGGPMVWGMLALMVVVAVVAILSTRGP